MYVLGAACCQQIPIHRKLFIELNSTFGTFSGICPLNLSGFISDTSPQKSGNSRFRSKLEHNQVFLSFLSFLSPGSGKPIQNDVKIFFFAELYRLNCF